MLMALAVSRGSFWLLCLGTFIIGFYKTQASICGKLPRWISRPQGKQARAISLVLAGGLFGVTSLGPA